MGVTSTSKQVNLERIDCDGTLQVTLALSASPDIVSNPHGHRPDPGPVRQPRGRAGRHRLRQPARHRQLQPDRHRGHAADHLRCGAQGRGRRARCLRAFSAARQLFDPLSANAKVIVLFTDGKTTAGPPPAPVAAAARAEGIILYCISLIGSDGIDVSVLNDWATDPDASHVAVTPDAADLEDLFRDLAANLSKTGATDIVIEEVVSADFQIASMSPPTKGTAEMQSSTALQWKIPELGVTANEGASLQFAIRHTANTAGLKLVNESLTYSATEGNVVAFPTPSVEVDCGTVVQEPCPVPVDFSIEGRDDFAVFDAGDVRLESLGRILELNFTVKRVCPGKRVALGVLLSEVGENGDEYPRGMKALTLPAHNAPSCRDIRVKCVRFVLLEDLSAVEEEPGCMCRERSFRVRTIAHPVDYGFRCCEADPT